MVKQRKKYTKKKRAGKGFNKNAAKARKSNASTPVETCSEQLSPFGVLLALVKFIDLVKFEEIFNFAYQEPRRKPKLGHYSMMIGILMLLFIGFNCNRVKFHPFKLPTEKIHGAYEFTNSAVV